MTYSKGSEWKKWDLHIHSNVSDGKGTPEEILQKAQEKGISVIALTDHHTADNIDKIKKLSKQYSITVLSGIEFRTEYGSSSVHMIGLFPDKHNDIELNSKALHDYILSPLGISKTHIIAKGKQQQQNTTLSDEAAFKEGMFLVQVDFKKAADLIREFGGIVTVHSGSKTNSFDTEIKHQGDAKKNVNRLCEALGTLKKELLNSYIDICEINKAGDSENFYLKNFNRPSIIASDAHEKADIGSKFTWIKAEPTFEGLRQLLIEPSERVKIQNEIPDEKGEYNIIDKVKFVPKNGSKKFSSDWIEMNQNLNTIIGGKSSGKSLLLYFIAKTLGKSKELNYDNEQLEIDDFIVRFKDGVEFKMTDKKERRPIVYIPQLYLNELADTNREELEKLLLSNLLEKDGVDIKKEKLKNKNILIEKKIYSCIIELFNKLETKTKELEKIGQYPEEQAIIDNLEKWKSRKDIIIKESTLSPEESKKYSELIEENKEMKINKNQIRRDKVVLDNVPYWMAATVHPKTEDLYDFIPRLDVSIEEDKKEFLTKIKEHNIYMKKWTKDLVDLSKKFSEKYKCLLEKLDLKLIKNIDGQKKYSDKIVAYEEVIKLEQIITEEEKALEKIRGHLSIIKKLEIEINKILDEIKTLLNDRYDNYKEIINLLNKNGHVNERLKIITKIDFEEEIFNENIGSILNLKQNFTEIIGPFFINNIYQYEADKHIENIMVIGDKVNLNDKIKFKSGKSKKDLCEELLKDNYKISYTLKENDDDLHQMSPGKKGIILFKLFLEQKNPKYPILVDQPEDNLDNRTVYNELIDFIKSKKKERQIIMITHNANLVVSTDAEEIIVANQSGENNTGENKLFKFEYVSGSLENSYENSKSKGILYKKGIKEHVCEILEGGEEAFKKREKSYRIKR
ncbi:MAG: TrlF family AAA-like ATPase [Fusobacteriaceae bacterium]